MPAKRITDQQRQQVIDLAQAGEGRNAIAAKVGIGTGTVTAIITVAGLSFDRTATEVATKARKTDLADRRSALELHYVQDAERLRLLVWSKMTYRELGSFQGTDGGAKYSKFVEYDQDTPTPQDQERLMRASVQAMTASQRIADAAGDGDTEQAKSMIVQLFDSMAEWKHRDDPQPVEPSA